jgi:hypothetical protein
VVVRRFGEGLHILVAQVGPHEPEMDRVPPHDRHHAHRKEQVEPNQYRVGVVAVLGDHGVAEPHCSDRGEAHQVRQVRGPQFDQRA